MKNDVQHFDQHLFVCINKRANGHPNGCCASKGAEDFLKTLKLKQKKCATTQKIRVNKSGCLGRCSEGVVMVLYPKNKWYLNVQESELDQIIKELE